MKPLATETPGASGRDRALPYWQAGFALFAGALLRIFFIRVYPVFVDDSAVYGGIARNLLVHGVYGLGEPPHATLIRLPGYPAFLAIIFSIFGVGNYAPVRPIQMVADLGTCLLIYGFVRDHASRRAALWALWIAALCPFTANYVAVPLTETPSIFCVALAMFAGGRLVRSLRSRNAPRDGRIEWMYLVLTAFALSWEVLLRPDGGLLAAAFLPGMWWYGRRGHGASALKAVIVCALLAALPFVPWTIRNARVFHVFQPLAPRSASDPGEPTFPGYIRWTKTWLADYVSSPEVYWLGNDQPIDIRLLPRRAFDTAEEYRETEALLDDYNQTTTITPAMDARFNALAAQRIRRHPVRFYLGLPALRLADMWLRPRTEMLADGAALRWWEWRRHPAVSMFSLAYAALDVALLALAIAGFARGRVPFAGMLTGYVVLRCLLLMTLENAEPRYTLEAFPMVIAAAAVAVARFCGEESKAGAFRPAVKR